jgi:hypothetical protein
MNLLLSPQTIHVVFEQFFTLQQIKQQQQPGAVDEALLKSLNV